MDSRAIRRTFLDFFAERGHTLVPSSALVPDDPTLLFTNAGMVQFKPYFLGEKEPPYLRAVTAQRCLRAVDLEKVGTNARHLSFFQMLGNFSFGDYFKKEAITWAWELVTQGFGLDPNRLWASVHTADREAHRFWLEEVGIPRQRTLRLATDFWDMGVAGPCGPCSHLYYDRGEQYGATITGNEERDDEIDEDRYFEIWNLVFIQNIQNDRLEVVGDLPKQNVDTGMGLERMAVVVQGVPTVFDVDSMVPILRTAEVLVGKSYGVDAAVDVSLRVMTEHARGVTFAVADGVIPSNEGRGYVLRRLIRRAVRYARLAGVDEPFMQRLIDVVVDLFADEYPDAALLERKSHIRHVVEREEAGFDRTLRLGLGILEEELVAARERGDGVIPDEVVFRLHDTYGFPLDMTKEIAEEEGLGVDLDGFERLMKEQRRRARAARIYPTGIPSAEAFGIPEVRAATEFVGYEQLEADSKIVAAVRDGGAAPELLEGSEGELVLARTPFYPEGGGQVGDRGRIATETGTFEVADTRRVAGGLIVHTGRTIEGEITSGQQALASVDPAHRGGVRQSHTATHMLHWSLRHFLGDHARQQGSLVEPGRLRFDFAHYEPVDEERLAQMEEELNRRVLFDDSVHAFETTYDYAMSIGAVALFGEKYGDYVRVVEVGEYSKELCGGTHVAHTGQVGVIKLVGEGSVGAGLRRVEAYTGLDGLRYLNEQAATLRRVAEMLRSDPAKVVERLEKTLAAVRELEAEMGRRRGAAQQQEVGRILSSDAVRDLGNTRLVVLRRDNQPVGDLRKLAAALRDRLGSGVVLIASAQNGPQGPEGPKGPKGPKEAANLIAAVSSDLIERGLSAPGLLARGAEVVGGKAGGGKPDLAVAGGPLSEEIERAATEIEAALRDALGG